MKKVRGEARRDTFQHHPFLFSAIVPVYQMSFRMQCKPNFPLVSEMRFTMMLVQHISTTYFIGILFIGKYSTRYNAIVHSSLKRQPSFMYLKKLANHPMYSVTPKLP